MSDGATAPVVTDGPFPDSKELLAGCQIVDDRQAAIVEYRAAAARTTNPRERHYLTTKPAGHADGETDGPDAADG